MTDDDQAKRRFMMLNVVRTGGVVFACLGLYFLAAPPFERAPAVGGFLIVIGLLDALVVPQVLARAWRTPKD